MIPPSSSQSKLKNGIFWIILDNSDIYIIYSLNFYYVVCSIQFYEYSLHSKQNTSRVLDCGLIYTDNASVCTRMFQKKM